MVASKLYFSDFLFCFFLFLFLFLFCFVLFFFFLWGKKKTIEHALLLGPHLHFVVLSFYCMCMLCTSALYC